MAKILFLGPNGSYSYIVAKKLQEKLKNYSLTAEPSFQDIHRELLKDKKSVAVLPFENSITSNVYENVEFVFDSLPNIIGEFYLPIELNLIGKKGVDISLLNANIYSHPKALKQSSNFIAKNKMNAITAQSTSQAQTILFKVDTNSFAIGSDVIDDSLEIKAKNIGNYSNNKTRFIFVSMGVIKLMDATQKKISFLCKLQHKKGSLLLLLNIIANLGINMTKIESKPIPNSNFEYSFMIEGLSDNTIEENKIKEVLNKNTITNSILGIY